MLIGDSPRIGDLDDYAITGCEQTGRLEAEHGGVEGVQ